MSRQLQVVCPHCDFVNELPAQRLAQQPYCGRCSDDLFAGRSVELGAHNFERHACTGDLPVVVMFCAAHCGYSLAMAPVFERAAASLEPEFRLVRIDIDEAPLIAQKYGVQSTPLLVALHRGREIGRRRGAAPLLELMGWISDQARRLIPRAAGSAASAPLQSAPP